MTPFMNPHALQTAGNNVVGRLVQLKVGGSDYRFECIGKINIGDLMTNTMPVKEINKGFDLMKSGEWIRALVMH